MKKINEINNRYGRLLVICEIEDSRRGAHWLCQCDCGNTVVVAGVGLRDGNNKSCGCLHTFPKGVAAANRVLDGYKRTAKLKNLEWDIQKKDFLDITQQNCHYCGEPPNRESSYGNNTGGYTFNGIDRIDNALGYTKKNVVPCCSWCNWAKKERTEGEFLAWIQKVWQHTLR